MRKTSVLCRREEWELDYTDYDLEENTIKEVSLLIDKKIWRYEFDLALNTKGFSKILENY